MEIVLPEDFCYQLEYTLTNTFKHSAHEDTKGYWCDGVSPEGVMIHDTIVTKAWIGKDGQDAYQLKIHLGKQAHIANDDEGSLIPYIPAFDTPDWWQVDKATRSVIVYLN